MRLDAPNGGGVGRVCGAVKNKGCNKSKQEFEKLYNLLH